MALALAAVLVITIAVASLSTDYAYAQQPVIKVPVNSDFVPDGLTLGDEFRLLFASSGYYDIDHTIQATYDKHIQDAIADTVNIQYGKQWDDYVGVYRDVVVGTEPTALSELSSHFKALVNTNPTTPNIYYHTNTGITEHSGIPIYWVNGKKLQTIIVNSMRVRGRREMVMLKMNQVSV